MLFAANDMPDQKEIQIRAANGIVLRNGRTPSSPLELVRRRE